MEKRALNGFGKAYDEPVQADHHNYLSSTSRNERLSNNHVVRCNSNSREGRQLFPVARETVSTLLQILFE